LKGAGVEKPYHEHTSALGPRPQLREALDFVRQGDTFVVCKPDRLARSVADLLRIVDKLKAKKVHLRILSMGVDTTTNTGKLILTVLGGIAEFERDLMLERQREGIAKAKAAGKYKGRAPTARRQIAEIVRLAKSGAKREDIARKLNIGIASVYRLLAESKRAAAE
jgi:DNA invertase Pin-like site-specific DNA recombinase